jgi:hypothetical protein
VDIDLGAHKFAVQFAACLTTSSSSSCNPNFITSTILSKLSLRPSQELSNSIYANATNDQQIYVHQDQYPRLEDLRINIYGDILKHRWHQVVLLQTYADLLFLAMVVPGDTSLQLYRL